MASHDGGLGRYLDETAHGKEGSRAVTFLFLNWARVCACCLPACSELHGQRPLYRYMRMYLFAPPGRIEVTELRLLKAIVTTSSFNLTTLRVTDYAGASLISHHQQQKHAEACLFVCNGFASFGCPRIDSKQRWC